MSVGGADGAVSSRPRAAKALSIALPVLVAAVATVAWFAPPEWTAWRMAAFVAAASWFAWLLWAWPLLLLSRATVLVRNSFTTWGIPLAAIDEVVGGRRLTFRLHDGRRLWAVAVNGGSVVFDGIRRADAYTTGPYMVGRMDDLRPSASRDLHSDATEWAAIIRTRLRGVTPDPTARAVRRPNWIVAVVTAASIGVLVAAVVLPS